MQVLKMAFEILELLKRFLQWKLIYSDFQKVLGFELKTIL